TGNGRCGLFFRPGSAEDLMVALSKSNQMNIERERERVLSQYKISMSAEAISGNMINAFNKITGSNR
ncbi:MAG: hypothetical protein C0490_28745, partial [Marivirga sp.]|nr:hypothetical protein [Marivirga sp.]